MPTIDWNATLLDQLRGHWTEILRPRLEGLTDGEYLWEPAPGAWNLRPRAEATTSMAAGGGEWVLDFEFPEPVPAPVTTIAWRLGHLIVGVLGMRNASHFGGAPMDYTSVDWPSTATGALAQLDAEYDRWVTGCAALGEAGLERPVGPSEGPYAEVPYAGLLLHIHREVIHHGAEIALLRDLYAHRIR